MTEFGVGVGQFDDNFFKPLCVVLGRLLGWKQIEGRFAQQFVERSIHVLQVGGVGEGDAAFQVDPVEADGDVLDQRGALSSSVCLLNAPSM